MLLLNVNSAVAVTPVTLYNSYAGNINFLSIGASFRTAPDAVSPCTVLAPGVVASKDLTTSIVDPATPLVTGLPAGSTVVAAHLYWAGSYSPTDPSSTATTPDYNVTFSTPLTTTAITADRTFTETFIYDFPAIGTVFDWFSGYKDVTALVSAAGNGIYGLTDLLVNTASPHCDVNGVLSGWALHVIYSNPAEPFRVINLFDGFQLFRGSSITLNPSNFLIPAVGINGKFGVTTWEGDVGNSTALGGFTENLSVNGTNLSDAINPINNQYNSTINAINPASLIDYGVDIDDYDITALLTAGDTSSTTTYSSGGDLVILSVEIYSVSNDPVADLAITKTHVGDFGAGIDNDYTITVTNNGPDDETGPIDVVDTLPAGMNFVAVSGTGWACSVAGAIISCSHPGPLVNGASLPPITLTVNVPSATPSTLTNSATVSGTLFDNISGNDTANDLTNIAPPIMTVLKMASSGTANPGTPITYTVQVTNTGLGSATSVSQDDRLSKYTSFGIECMPGGLSIVYTDGTPASTLIKGTPVYSNDGGVTFTYVPPALGGPIACTYDPNITHFRLPMTGTMPPLGTYSLQYQVQVK